MRRIASTALATFGIIAVAIGIGFMTFWAPDGNVRATAKAPDAAFVKTEAGVIDLIGEDVSISLEAPDDSEVIVAFGNSDDIDAWADGLNVASVSGLSDWDTLKVEAPGTAVEETPTPEATVTAEATPAPEATATDDAAASEEFDEVDPGLLAESDMWIQVEQGKKKVDLSYRVADPGAISLLATTTTGKAPTLTLSWQHETNNGLAVPLIAIGVLVTMIGVLLFALDIQESRRRAARRAEREAKFARRAERASATTSVLSQSALNALIAEKETIAEAPREAQAKGTAQAFGAGIVPMSTRSEEFRNRKLAQEDRIVLPEPAESTPVPDAGEESTEGDEGAVDTATESLNEDAAGVHDGTIVTPDSGDATDHADEDDIDTEQTSQDEHTEEDVGANGAASEADDAASDETNESAPTPADASGEPIEEANAEEDEENKNA